MTWIRLGQLTAETRSVADVARLAGAAPTASNNKAMTGQYSYRGSSAAFGLALGAPAVALRCAAFINHNTGLGSALSGVLRFTVGDAEIGWQYRESDNNFLLAAGYASGTATPHYPAPNVLAGGFSTADVWRHVALMAYLAPSGGFVAAWLDGVQVLGWTGDTRVYASNSTTPLTWLSGAYLLGGGWNLSVYGDDFYCDVWEGADAPLMACPSSRRFLPAFPNGAGATAQWTPNSGANWQAVDEAPPDSETTYVKATVAGLRDSYSFSDIAVPADYTVRAVIPTAFARRTDAAVGSTLKLVSKKDAAVSQSAEKVLPVAYNHVWERFPTQPDGSPWDEAAVNASEFGIESSGVYA